MVGYGFVPLRRYSRTNIASIIMGIILFIFYVVCPISTPKEEAIRSDIFMVIAGIKHKSLIVHSRGAFISFVMVLATRQSPARLLALSPARSASHFPCHVFYPNNKKKQRGMKHSAQYEGV